MYCVRRPVIDPCIYSYAAGKSKQSTAGSFVRPSRPADKPRGFLEALREKYASEFERLPFSQRGSAYPDSIEISGKVVEEVGFDKIRKQLAQLQELKIVLLDGLCVAGILPHDGRMQKDTARRETKATCPKIAELDLSRSLLSRWADVADICEPLKRLRVLKLKYVSLDVDTAVADILQRESVWTCRRASAS